MVSVLISFNAFPNGDAGAVRDYSFAKIYTELGYKPIIICRNPLNKYGRYNEIVYYSTFSPAKSLFDKIVRSKKTTKQIIQYINKINKEHGRISVIHLYDATLDVIEWIKKYCKQNNVILIHDSVEWYSPCEFKKGIFDKAYILKEILNRYSINREFKVIAISSYLQKYFSQKGIESVRIPVIMDVEGNHRVSVNTTKKVKLIYAGSPATKDHLKEILDAVSRLPLTSKKKIEIHILGVSEEELMILGKINKIDDCILVYGRVSREKVLEVMLQMDFSLLLRPDDERYTKAGFPTKSVEALSHGVAMMCNISSDLGLYLEDGKNSIIVSACTTEAISTALERVIGMSRTEINNIKANARALAEKEFDYRKYKDCIKKLIVGRDVKDV